MKHDKYKPETQHKQKFNKKFTSFSLVENQKASEKRRIGKCVKPGYDKHKIKPKKSSDIFGYYR